MTPTPESVCQRLERGDKIPEEDMIEYMKGWERTNVHCYKTVELYMITYDAMLSEAFVRAIPTLAMSCDLVYKRLDAWVEILESVDDAYDEDTIIDEIHDEMEYLTARFDNEAYPYKEMMKRVNTILKSIITL